MMTTGTDLRSEHAAWRAEREELLREPHGWLSLTALNAFQPGGEQVGGRAAWRR